MWALHLVLKPPGGGQGKGDRSRAHFKKLREKMMKKNDTTLRDTTMRDAAVVSALMVFLVSICFWMMAVAVDKQYCKDHGLEYGRTSLSLVGYCRLEGMEVRAESLGYRRAH